MFTFVKDAVRNTDKKLRKQWEDFAGCLTDAR